MDDLFLLESTSEDLLAGAKAIPPRFRADGEEECLSPRTYLGG